MTNGRRFHTVQENGAPFVQTGLSGCVRCWPTRYRAPTTEFAYTPLRGISQPAREKSSGSATGTKDSTKPSKLGKFGEIDRVYQLRAAVGGANLPLRLVPGRGGETPPGMWGQRV